MTEFHFVHDFRAPSPAAVFAAYFDPTCSDEQDRRTELVRREVLELEDRPEALRRVCRVVPRRQLPAIVRPFVRDELSFRETLTWRKAEDLIEMQIVPSILGGRIEISATYRVTQAGPGVCRRTYDGQVSAQIRLLGRQIERAIVEDMGKGLETSVACTQEWLDARA